MADPQPGERKNDLHGVPVPPGAFERLFTWASVQWNAFAAFVVVFFTPIIAAVVWLAGHIKSFVLWVYGLLAALVYWGSDPYRLRVYGDHGLTRRSHLDIMGYTVLLSCSWAFELFAWSSMWGYTGVAGVVLMVLPFIFAAMILLLDRGIVVMDDDSGEKKWWVIPSRVTMLVALAMITSLAVEMKVFAPEIDRHLAAAEKVEVDKIRLHAKEVEQGLIEKQQAASEQALTESPDDVVARRAPQLAEIVARLDAKSKEVVREVATGGSSGHGRGDGIETAALRRQETELRAEKTAFEAETERMRLEAISAGAQARSTRSTEIDERMIKIDAMTPEALAAAYGGEYKQPDGFLARLSILFGILDEPDEHAILGLVNRNTLIVWGCRFVMITFGLAILFVKFVMTSQETKAYLSLRSQALTGNPEAIRTVRTLAQLDGQHEAVHTLRLLARKDQECMADLAQLGMDGNVELAAWSPEIVAFHNHIFARRSSLAAALGQHEDFFRGLCRDRKEVAGVKVCLTRSELEEQGKKHFRDTVQPLIAEVSGAEGNLQNHGGKVPEWSLEALGEPDPRKERLRLWQLPDEELFRRFSWQNPWS